VKRKSNNKPVVKAQVKVVETPEQKKAREAQAAQLKATEEAARRKAAEEAQQRTLEQMRQMASKYSNEDATATIRVVDDSPLAAVWLVKHMKTHLRKKTAKSNVVPIRQLHAHRRKAVVVVKSNLSVITRINVV
jgi:hypothetical protein